MELAFDDPEKPIVVRVFLRSVSRSGFRFADCTRRLASIGDTEDVIGENGHVDLHGPEALHMTVSVVIPFRAGACPQRDRVWAWLRAKWEAAFPAWEVVEGIHDGGGPWRKGVAVSEGVAQARGEIVVVVDADVWSDGVSTAVEAVRDGAPWVMPFNRLLRFTEAATARVLAGEDLPTVGEDRRSWAERPSVASRPAGGIVILRREAALAVPIDPRFAGWGGEDAAWKDALDTLVGRHVVLPGTLYHLYHPPQSRMSRAQGSRENERLRRAYARVRLRRDGMLRLVAEAAESFSS